MTDKLLVELRKICDTYKTCYDGCPLLINKDCLVCKPPANLTDEDIDVIVNAITQIGVWKNDNNKV